MEKYSSPSLRLENPGQPHSLHLFYPIPAFFQITHPCAQYFSKLVKCAHRRSNLSNWETKLTENDAIVHYICEFVQFLTMKEIFIINIKFCILYIGMHMCHHVRELLEKLNPRRN